MNLYGCRKVLVFTAVTEVEMDRHGSYGYVEIENPGQSNITVFVNDFPEQGHIGTAIPIKAGTTRHLPLAIYKLRATDVVNIIAYGM